MTDLLRLMPLIRTIADGRFHSGTALGEALGISRAAVWKQIQQLPDLGIHLHSVRGKGYRLPEPLELLDAERIQAQLPDQSGLRQLVMHEHIDSTNQWAMQQARAGAAGGLVTLAEWQSSGRGRRGRTWVSPFGCNLYLSLMWRYNGGPQVLEGLSLALGVAVAQAIESLGISGIQLKWPNDLLYEQRKLGGILVEMGGESTGPIYVVAGIGLNIGMPTQPGDDIDRPWVDLRECPGGRHVSRNALAAVLIEHCLKTLAGYESRGFSPYRPDWEQRHAHTGLRVVLERPNHTQIGIARGVDNSGALLLDTDNGPVACQGGEVSLRFPPHSETS